MPACAAAAPSPSPSPAPAAVTWEIAPACRDAPNKTNSVQDGAGRLWGWQEGKACAYKTSANQPIYYASKQLVATPSNMFWSAVDASLNHEGLLWLPLRQWDAGTSRQAQQTRKPKPTNCSSNALG